MNNICSFFDQFTPELKTKIYVHNKREHFLLVDSNDKYHFNPCKIYTGDLGAAIIDFAYDDSLEKILYYLAHSDNEIRKLKEDSAESQNWSMLITLANALYRQKELHPFYYLVLSTIVNLYKRNMCNEDGSLVNDNILVEIGRSLAILQTDIRTFLDNCSRVDEDNNAALKYYLNHQYRTVEIRKIVLDLIPVTTYQEEVTRVVPSPVLHPESAMDIWNYLLPVYFQSTLSFRRCDNCGKYFVTTGAGCPKYCERITEGTKLTCRQLMAKEKVRTKNTTNPINVLFNRTYKTMYSRVSAQTLSHDTFHVWAKDARQVRDKCIAGIISLEDFADWLESSRRLSKYRH